MKFKVLKGTALFDKLWKVQIEMALSTGEAKKLVNELGYEEFRPRDFVVSGGISSIIIPSGKPEGWKHAGAMYPKDEFMPAKRKANKELLNRIEALPVVEYRQINDPLNYDKAKRIGNRFSFCPAISWGEDCIVISVSEEMIYTPVADMIEITTSEYNTLFQSIRKKDEV